jgi:membrane-bound lytic murein transglycosylase D
LLTVPHILKSLLLAICLFLFAGASQAEENQDLSTHLPYTAFPQNDELIELDPALLPAAPSLSNELSLNNSLPPSDVWQRIRQGYGIPELDTPLIAKHEQWYISRPDYVARMMDRTRRYLFYIVEEVERRKMPMEIALLPMIESAFNPVANSTSSAAGIWQFIPSTGKDFGLQQNWWYDGRRDIISATDGALDYLQKLHGMFGDWQLALAAYNWGEGAVSRAQERNRRKGLPTNFASLTMPEETQNYVPKLLAIKHLITDPTSYGICLSDIPNRPYFGTVATAQHIDLKRAAQLAEISMDEFIALNPAHNRPIILQNNNNILLLPIEKIETFVNNLDSTELRLVSWQAYQPKRGERLDKLAPRFGISTEKLRSINGLSANSKVCNGQKLLVPIVDDEDEIEFAPFTPTAPAAIASEERAMRTIRHTVHRGETLASIAKEHGVTAASISALNDGVKNFKSGQQIIIAHTSRAQHSHAIDRIRNNSVSAKTQHHSAKPSAKHVQHSSKKSARKGAKHAHKK